VATRHDEVAFNNRLPLGNLVAVWYFSPILIYCIKKNPVTLTVTAPVNGLEASLVLVA
jgi:hypothetical protein